MSLTSTELAELRLCLANLAKVGEGIANAMIGINALLQVGGAACQRAGELGNKLADAQQGSA